MNRGPTDSERSRPASDFEETAKHANPPVRRPPTGQIDKLGDLDPETTESREAREETQTGTKTLPHQPRADEDDFEQTETTRREAGSSGRLAAVPVGSVAIPPTLASSGIPAVPSAPSAPSAPSTPSANEAPPAGGLNRTLIMAPRGGGAPGQPSPAHLLTKTLPLPVSAAAPLPASTPRSSPTSMPAPAYAVPTVRPARAETMKTSARAAGDARRRIRTLRLLLFVVWTAIVGVTLFTLRVVRELRTQPALAEPARVVAAPKSAVAPAATTPSSESAVASAEPSSTPPPPAESSAPTASSLAEAAPAPSPTASASASAAAPSGATSAAAGDEEGVLVTSQAIAGRRVWVDGALVGQTPESFTVKCGRRHVRVGTAGKSQAVDVPCGGELDVK